jgi:hypothetical protein
VFIRSAPNKSSDNSVTFDMAHEDDVDGPFQKGEDRDLLDTFFRVTSRSAPGSARLNFITRFCGSITLQELKASLSAAAGVFLLHQSDAKRTRTTHEHFFARITAPALYEELQDCTQQPSPNKSEGSDVATAPIYPDSNFKSATIESVEAQPQRPIVAVTKIPHRNASIITPGTLQGRIIHVININSLVVHILAATVSWHDASPLRQALCRHFSSAICAEVHEAAGDNTLSFNLPVIAWYRSRSLTRDNRTDRQGRPLRGFEDVTQFDWESESPSYLFYGHYTCAISSHDGSYWTAYCFDDTDPEFGSRDDYYLHAGAFGSNDELRHVEDPFVFFLATFASRMEALVEEWEIIVERLELAMGDRLKVSHCSSLSCRH